MKKILMMFVGSLLLLFGGATFVSADLMLLGQGTSTHGTFNLIYDTDLDITWYDYTNGSGFNGDPWQDQVDWANSLSVNFGSNTYTDWRLPTTVDDPTSLAFNITTSDMGHLFYAELGNVGRLDTDGNPTGCDYDDCLSNTGDFQNLINDDYWSGTEITSYTEDPNGLSHAWRFNFGLGHQNYNSKITPDWAIAVHPGLLTPEPVPEPTIDDILDFSDESVADGTIEGRGKRWLANTRLWIFGQMLESVKWRLDNDKIKQACKKLDRAYLRCDGESRPKDFIIGPAAVPVLADMINELMISLKCK